jgi:hypothetical protein
VHQTRMAAAIGQVATLGRRPHRNTPPKSCASRADQLLGLGGESSRRCGRAAHSARREFRQVSRRLRWASA